MHLFPLENFMGDCPHRGSRRVFFAPSPQPAAQTRRERRHETTERMGGRLSPPSFTIHLPNPAPIVSCSFGSVGASPLSPFTHQPAQANTLNIRRFEQSNCPEPPNLSFPPCFAPQAKREGMARNSNAVFGVEPFSAVIVNHVPETRGADQSLCFSFSSLA